MTYVAYPESQVNQHGELVGRNTSTMAGFLWLTGGSSLPQFLDFATFWKGPFGGTPTPNTHLFFGYHVDPLRKRIYLP